MSRALYDINYDLIETRDGEESPYGRGAVFGEYLDRLIEDLEETSVARSTLDKQLLQVTQERDTLKKELDQIKEQLLEAFKDGGEVKTSQGKRNTYPGQIVMYKSSGGVQSPAMVMEVCGFPVGKVGLRVFDRYGNDKFVYATYREDGEMRTYADTWRFID